MQFKIDMAKHIVQNCWSKLLLKVYEELTFNLYIKIFFEIYLMVVLNVTFEIHQTDFGISEKLWSLICA